MYFSLPSTLLLSVCLYAYRTEREGWRDGEGERRKSRKWIIRGKGRRGQEMREGGKRGQKGREKEEEGRRETGGREKVDNWKERKMRQRGEEVMERKRKREGKRKQEVLEARE